MGWQTMTATHLLGVSCLESRGLHVLVSQQSTASRVCIRLCFCFCFRFFDESLEGLFWVWRVFCDTWGEGCVSVVYRFLSQGLTT
jgi:hypothetical protein